MNEHVELAEAPDATETLVRLHDTERPVAGLTDVESPTVPENPPRLEAVMVDEPLDPSWKVTVVGLADRAKSATLTVTWAVCETPLLFPVTVTMYVPPAEELTVSVEVPDPPAAIVMLVGLNDADSPDGATTAVRLMVPANPPRLLTVIVDVLDWPAVMFTVVGLAAMEKSTTLRLILTVRVIEPLVAVTVTV